ncbi:DNA polymerase III subunit gamma/tau [Paraglaciecola aestuariivivens]
MSYQVLARKWRPNRFGELVGQEHVVTAISNALDNNRLHHAYLFTGTRGVGKTTIARIFSKSLNCEQGLSAKPCGQCSTCQEIENGNFIDLLEIDAASRTKVEDTRELLDNVQYKPSRGRYKVYLIDEVHMLSKHSFNALLKTLEEPPPHVKFLLATTDPQKLPVTILSRCLQFNLKALSRSQIAQQLEHVLTQEQIQFEKPSIAQLARAAQGSMRDALSLTDQAIAQGNGQVSLQVVTDMLGLMDKNQVLKLVHAVLQKDSETVMQQVEHMAQQAPDFALVLAEIMSLLHQVALTQFVPDACKLETISARAVFQLAKAVPAEHVQLLYQIALAGKKDLPHAVDARTGVEMTLLRMLAFCPKGLSLTPLDIASLAAEAMTTQSDSSPATKAPAAPLTDLQLSVENKVETGEPAQQIQNDTSAQQTPSAPQVEAPKVHAEPSAQAAPQAQPELEQEESQNEAQLFAQQQDILRQAEDFGHQNFDYNELEPIGLDEVSQHLETFTTEQAAPASDIAGSDAVTPAQTSTADLIALRNKLKTAPRSEEEGSESVKKSEGKASFDLAAIRKQQREAEAQAEANSEEAQVQPQLASESQVTPAAISADTSNNTHEQPQGSSEPLDSTSNPPWATEDSSTSASELSKNHQLESLPAANSNSQPEPEPEQFDPNAHLDDENVGEVTLTIPAFLADQQKVVKAKQVDDWSKLIEDMQITALTKQLALHSSYSRENNKVSLTLLESKSHLISATAKQQLHMALAEVLNAPIELEIELGQPINTPYALQLKVNQVRHDYACEVVKNDPGIQLLQQQFAAKVDEQSIQAR